MQNLIFWNYPYFNRFLRSYRSSYLFLATIEKIATSIKYQYTNDGVDRVVAKLGQLCNAIPFSRKYEGTQMSGCNKAAGSNWTQNCREYDRADLVTKQRSWWKKVKRLLLHAYYLTDEWHAHKISNHFFILIPICIRSELNRTMSQHV